MTTSRKLSASTFKKLHVNRRKKTKKRSPLKQHPFLKFIIGMMVVIVLLGVLAVVAPRKQTVSQIASVTDLGTFSGVLPCADCEEINTTITFNLSSDEKEPHTYVETDSYIGKGTLVTTNGTWQYTTSTTMPDEVIIELTENDDVGSKEYYMVVNDTTIKMLNQNKEPITDTPMPLTLTKQN